MLGALRRDPAGIDQIAARRPAGHRAEPVAAIEAIDVEIVGDRSAFDQLLLAGIGAVGHDVLDIERALLMDRHDYSPDDVRSTRPWGSRDGRRELSGGDDGDDPIASDRRVAAARSAASQQPQPVQGRASMALCCVMAEKWTARLNRLRSRGAAIPRGSGEAASSSLTVSANRMIRTRPRRRLLVLDFGICMTLSEGGPWTRAAFLLLFSALS